MASVRIERIEIGAFGCLSGVVIEPSDGINLIEADNESGKSTLAAFIKFILYGFSSTRSQSIAENERKLYIPWNGTRAFGSIVFSAPGGRFRVARAYDLPSKETVEMTDLQTGREVFRSLVPGEVLLGVPEEVYQKSAYFRQLFQNRHRNVIFPGLIFGVSRLGHPQESGEFRLAAVAVLPQVPDSRIHGHHLMPT